MHKIAPPHIFLALFFAITLLPFVLNLFYDYHNSQRLLQFILLLLSSLLCFSKMKIKLVNVNAELRYAFNFFIVLNILSSLLSSFPISSFFNVLHYIALAYLVIFICQQNKNSLESIWISLF